MRATVTIEKDVLDKLVKATGAKTKSAAVRKVIDESGIISCAVLTLDRHFKDIDQHTRLPLVDFTP